MSSTVPASTMPTGQEYAVRLARKLRYPESAIATVLRKFGTGRTRHFSVRWFLDEIADEASKEVA